MNADVKESNLQTNCQKLVCSVSCENTLLIVVERGRLWHKTKCEEVNCLPLLLTPTSSN